MRWVGGSRVVIVQRAWLALWQLGLGRVSPGCRIPSWWLGDSTRLRCILHCIVVVLWSVGQLLRKKKVFRSCRGGCRGVKCLCGARIWLNGLGIVPVCWIPWLIWIVEEVGHDERIRDEAFHVLPLAEMSSTRDSAISQQMCRRQEQHGPD